MRFSDQFLRTLRERVSIAGYAGRRLAWDRRKSQPARGDYWACCPFHTEKSPSFHVLDVKGIFNCFGCGEKGDVVTLAMKLEGLSFPEAVERLAREAGLELPARTDAPADAAASERRKRLFFAVSRAQVFFQKSLAGPEGRAARAYLARRGVDEAVCARFGLGYAPGGWTAALDHLREEGFSAEELAAAGLTREKEGRRPIDAFRDRVMFPIADAQGRIIAFGGRAMDPNESAKYVNSAETELFHKGRTLYRLKEARETLARAKGRGLIVAEGYLDVIAFERAGLPAVAPLGTALTEDQLQLLWKSGPEPTLCFDGDAAGAKAAHRALDLALPHLSPAHTVRFALLPTGQDPDDVFRARGPEALAPLIADARPAVEHLFSREAAREPLTTPEARASLKARLKEAAGRIQDEETRRQYLRALLAKADDALGGGFRPKGEWRKPHAPPARAGARPGRFEPPPVATAELMALKDKRGDEGLEDVLRFAVDWPDACAGGAELLAALAIADPALDRIRHALLDLAAAGAPVDRNAVNAHLTALGEARAIARVCAWPPLQFDLALATPDERVAIEKQWMAHLALLVAKPGIAADLAAGSIAPPDDDAEAFARAAAQRRARIDADRIARGGPPPSGADRA